MSCTSPIGFVAILGVALFADWTRSADLPWHGGSHIHFAQVAEGEAILTGDDRFLKAIGPFDRQSRVETDREVSLAEFRTFIGAQVRAWTAEEEGKLRGIFSGLRARLEPLRLPIPPVITLVKTSGREEGDAAYCRPATIVLPESKLSDSPQSLERLLVHELFHVLSAHDRDFRERCYRVIGFQLVPPITMPASLLARRITNPDGPLLDAVLPVTIENAHRFVVPVLFSSTEMFDPRRGGPFFKYVTFRLMVVEKSSDGWHPVTRDKETWLLSPGEVPDFGRQIGRNTGYIIHPDEVLADNFSHLVFATPQLPSPEIVESLRQECANRR